MHTYLFSQLGPVLTYLNQLRLHFLEVLKVLKGYSSVRSYY